MKTATYTLPAHWACTLINGDSSGNEPEDDAAIKQWLESHSEELGPCLTCSDEPEFRHWHDAPGVLACDCLEFTFPVLESKQ